MATATNLMGVGFSAGAANQLVAEMQAAPTSTTPGAVTQQPAIANLSAAPTAADFNGLLAALRSSGVLAT